jgi:hypothetical protein
MRLNHKFEGKLKPNEIQRKILDSIFIAPEFVLYLFLKNNPIIHDLNDAQLFLLINRNELNSYLPAEQRSKLIDILSGFLVEWSKKLPSHINIEFFGKCQINNVGTYSINVAKLGDLKISNKDSFGKFPQNTTNTSFVIAKSDENYFSHICHSENFTNKILSNTTQHKEKIIKKLDRRCIVITVPAKVKKRPIFRSKIIAKTTTCPLCGKIIIHGEMLRHKHDKHGESMYAQSSASNNGRLANAWVQFFQGGAPGLGKGKS